MYINMAITEEILNNQYSIAQTRHHLAEIVHEVESGRPVNITRRGKPVAVLLSQADFESLSGQHAPDLWDSIMEFRTSHDLAQITDEDFANLRDPSAARESSWEA